MSFSLLYSISDRGVVETHEKFSDAFPLCGYLYKLKHKPTLLGGLWNKRYFVVEERRGKTTSDWYFSYYHDESKTNNVKEAGEAVLLQSITHVSLLATSGRLPLYTSESSLLDDKSKKELLTHKDLILEVETPSRAFFLRAESRHDLLQWAAGLQRMCAFPVTATWPADLGHQLPIPEQILKARLADGTCPPEIAKLVRPYIERTTAGAVVSAGGTRTSSMDAAAHASKAPAPASPPTSAPKPDRSTPTLPISTSLPVPSRTPGGEAPQSPSSIVPDGPFRPNPAPASQSTGGSTAGSTTQSSVASRASSPASVPARMNGKGKEDVIIVDDEDDEKSSATAGQAKGRDRLGSGLPLENVLSASKATASSSVAGGKPTVPDARTKQGLLEAAIASAARRQSQGPTAEMKETSMRKASVESACRPTSAGRSIADDFDEGDEDAEEGKQEAAASKSSHSVGIATVGTRAQVSLASVAGKPPIRPASTEPTENSPVPSSWMAPKNDAGFQSHAPKQAVQVPAITPKGVVGADRDWDAWDEEEDGKRAAPPSIMPTRTTKEPLVPSSAPVPKPAGLPPAGLPSKSAAVNLVRGSLHTKQGGSSNDPKKLGDPGVAADKDFVEADWDS